MARLFFLPGFAQTRPRFRSRGPATAPKRQHNRLHLELLEYRCVPSTVTILADAGPGSLRDALATTPPGGTVDFQPGLSGTITLTGATLDIAQDVTIAGPGAGVITVSGNNTFQVFNIGPAVTVTISGLTIANGSIVNGDGGGISNRGTLAVAGCTISGNSVKAITQDAFGGGIYNTGMLTLASSTVTGNSVFAQGISLAFGHGGGIFNNGTLVITDCTVSDNAAASGSGPVGVDTDGTGGGIDNVGTLTITDSTLSDNSAGGDGYNGLGGALSNSGMLMVTGCTFSDNRALVEDGYGGGIYNSGTATIRASTICDNSAPGITGTGGGINNFGTLTLTGCLISRNTASGGGGINSEDGILSLIGCTISDNFCAGDGGGLAIFSSATIIDSTIGGNTTLKWGGGIYVGPGDRPYMLTIKDSTISGNFTTFGGALGIMPAENVSLRNTIVAGNSGEDVWEYPPDLTGSLNGLGHNLIGIGDGGSGYADTDLVGTAANRINPVLGPLQDNGGPTQTMALLPGSPAIGAGALTDMEWDQRGPGYPRLVNGTTDIGAYEVQDNTPAAHATLFSEATLGVAQTAPSPAFAPPSVLASVPGQK
jgi:hypothetical protein